MIIRKILIESFFNMILLRHIVDEGINDYEDFIHSIVIE